jgi:hypothetical protein
MRFVLSLFSHVFHSFHGFSDHLRSASETVVGTPTMASWIQAIGRGAQPFAY